MTLYTNGTIDRPELVEVHLDLIEPNPWQPRRSMDPEYIKELMESIADIGLLQEPLARPSSAGGGKVQLAFGDCRVAALRGLHADGRHNSRATLKIANLTDEAMAYIALAENTDRKDLSPAEKISAWAKVLREIEGVTIQSLADKVGVDRSTMSKNLAVLNLPKNVLDLLHEGVMKLRAAREFLCLWNENHIHEDAIQMVLKGLAGDEEGLYPDTCIPDYRVKTVRQELRAVASGVGGRGVVGHYERSREWRPLFEGQGVGSRAVPFDVAAFKAAFPNSIHTLPEGELSGGMEWTCEAKEWGRWSARASRELSKATAGTGQAKAAPPKKKKNETEEEAWWKVVKRDPVVQAQLGKRLSKAKTVKDLTKEDREALGTRVEPKVKDAIALPAEAQPGGMFLTKDQERHSQAARPPLFDFSGCATCTVGARWQNYDGGYQLVCGNEKLYNDRQSQGVQEWTKQLAAKREADAKDDALGIVKLSAVSLGEREAEVLVRSMSGWFLNPTKVRAHDWEWRKYDYWPEGAASFAQMVGFDLPSAGDYYPERQWEEAVQEFFAADLDGFDWRRSLSCLLVWQARIAYGLGARLWAVAMATEDVTAEAVAVA